jgi:hypothetical protein
MSLPPVGTNEFDRRFSDAFLCAPEGAYSHRELPAAHVFLVLLQLRHLPVCDSLLRAGIHLVLEHCYIARIGAHLHIVNTRSESDQFKKVATKC